MHWTTGAINYPEAISNARDTASITKDSEVASLLATFACKPWPMGLDSPRSHRLAIQLNLSLPLSCTLSRTTLSHTRSFRSIPILPALPLFVRGLRQRTRFPRAETNATNSARVDHRRSRSKIRHGATDWSPRFPTQLLAINLPTISAREEPTRNRPEDKRRRDRNCGHRYSRVWKARVSGSEENPQRVEARQSAIRGLTCR